MSEYLVGQVLKKIKEVYPLYYRLVLIVGPAGSGKTKILQEGVKSKFSTFQIQMVSYEFVREEAA